ncbi:unnamed protein product [Adineta ricciae]|uniref:Uncharacterized protein n=1 Tax=Adineta ricciae TaxID=249248 RepID=A0A814QKW8_ADIRI|nr:unnamed protein product [Adineta ricciae]CAF1121200.1 unnamed protein product [Adineta ricciae]
MAASNLESLRKYTVDVTTNEAIDELNNQLRRLLDDTHINFIKRKKMLLQLERKHNQLRRLIAAGDFVNQQQVTHNTDLIRRIKKKIIADDRQQRQRRHEEQEQAANLNWSAGYMTIVVGGAFAGVLCAATFIIMILYNSKEKYI